MTAVRNIVDRGAPNVDKTYPGDLLLLDESISAGAITTVGTGVLSAAAIATGIIYRTGSTAAYADVFDSATNIITALKGNAAVDANVTPGSTFRLLVVNTVAFADTVAASTDASVSLGTGVTAIAASTWREYLITILNSSPNDIYQMVTDGSTAVITFAQQPNGTKTISLSAGVIFPSSGAQVTGTGIPAGSTVLNMITGPGGCIGFTISANTTVASGANGTAVTFGPKIRVDGLRSGPL